MKLLCSAFILGTVPFINFCNKESEPVIPDNTIIIKTTDEKGNGVKSSLVYESRDCEYDFNLPSKAQSDKNGIIKIKAPAGYFQFYVEGFLNESYRCFLFSGKTEIITVYGSRIPTYIQTKPFAKISWFSNTSGDCRFEQGRTGSAKADAGGKATLYLPFQDTYKIQVGNAVQCFQPDQEIHTLVF